MTQHLDDDQAQQIERARSIVKALACAHVGSHHPLSDLETEHLLDEVADDPQMVYLALRWFAALTAGLAETLAGVVAEAGGIEILRAAIGADSSGVERSEEDALVFIRGIDNLTFGAP